MIVDKRLQKHWNTTVAMRHGTPEEQRKARDALREEATTPLLKKARKYAPVLRPKVVVVRG